MVKATIRASIDQDIQKKWQIGHQSSGLFLAK